MKNRNAAFAEENTQPISSDAQRIRNSVSRPRRRRNNYKKRPASARNHPRSTIGSNEPRMPHLANSPLLIFNPDPPPLLHLLNNIQNLTLVSWNANGIRSRVEEFREFITEWNPDIINLQETHIQACHHLSFPNYNIYRTDRTFRGGGTAILIKRNIPHHEVKITNPSFELTAIQIVRPNSQPITVISAYRSPTKPILIQDLHLLFRNHDYILVAGDLNAKHHSWSPLTQQNVAGHTIRRFCDSTGFSLNAPLEPTHFHNSLRNTIIDLAICKGMTVTEVTSIPELSSDHNPVLFEVSLDNFTSPALSTYAFPNWFKFQNILTSTLPGNPKISNINEIDDAILNFNSTLKNAFNNSSTFKSINKPLSSIPSVIREKIKLKNKLRKDWQNTTFKTQLNKLQKDIKKEL
ncbi:putative RNA-directed DNA polymerase from transposon X-element [Trichonephila clavata]|uniref:Putative RNA-directed DNA polymerase from transposon X-element n=1 Tax=Trichonephila clavata TaxID=2740835 RepID=A0A8X6I4S7_TRICU|nr:putative RNA-directed DNA polymerase from transposon X-element [Trichonephila clavata]